jgi:hypothetical protein
MVRGVHTLLFCEEPEELQFVSSERIGWKLLLLGRASTTQRGLLTR